MNIFGTLLIIFYLLEGMGSFGLKRNLRSTRKLPDYYTTDQCNIVCDKSAKYRTMDGSCNNRKNPCWGKSYRTYNALIPPDKFPGNGCTEKGLPNTVQPMARVISRDVHTDSNVTSRMSQLFLVFGQFQTHDISGSINPSNKNEEICPLRENATCGKGVLVPAGDPIWKSPGCAYYPPTAFAKCSTTGLECGCTSCKPSSAKRQYINGATSFLDGSNMYGATEERGKQLRQSGTAYLRMDGPLLARTRNPESAKSPCEVTTPDCDDRCFDIGDDAGNLNILLASMYTMWFREHNRLVDKLKPYINDKDILFEEVRKIVGAMIQHITHAEYLPLLFGECMPEDLKVSTTSTFYYDPTVDPTETKECNFGSCRYGHSMIRGYPKLYKSTERIDIGRLFNMDPFCDKNMADKLIGGTIEEEAMRMDRHVTTRVRDYLKFPGSNYTDLLSLGFLRVRDNNLPGYMDLLEYCHLYIPKNYEEMKMYIDDEALEIYRGLYGENSMNFDAYSTALTEKPLCAGILGPVTACIVAEHHRRAKFGDRLWYENLGEPESLTREQIKEIQKTTISRIICSNSRNVKEMQEHGFQMPGENNRIQSCEKIAKNGDLDATKWRRHA